MCRTHGAVERLDRPPPEVIRRDYVRANRPVLIGGVADSWGAVGRWTPEYFRESFPKELVTVRFWEGDGPFDEPESYLRDIRTGVTRLGAFVDSMRASPNPKSYVLNFPLLKHVPRLRQDVGSLDPFMGFPAYYPRRLRERLKEEPKFFLGPAGTVSALHFDGYNNFFVQVYGRKKFLLIPPEQSRFVYYPWSYPRTHYSPVNVGRPDLEKFPLFAKATPLEVVVEPGEILFIPVRWWHYVLALEESISLNFWWYSAATVVRLRHPFFVHGKGRLLGYLRRRLPARRRA